ncbi:MAG: tetratricopeptide repeat protein [Acidobacteria bacterium]|nr:tetratricopeptide repeat protein [Acidobacteriota bacterium]
MPVIEDWHTGREIELAAIKDLIDSVRVRGGVVGIVGRGGTGKSVFAGLLVHHLYGHRESVVFVDAKKYPTAEQILQQLLRQLGAAESSVRGVSDLRDSLERWVEGRQWTFLVDAVNEMRPPFSTAWLPRLTPGNVMVVVLQPQEWLIQAMDFWGTWARYPLRKMARSSVRKWLKAAHPVEYDELERLGGSAIDEMLERTDGYLPDVSQYSERLVREIRAARASGRDPHYVDFDFSVPGLPERERGGQLWNRILAGADDAEMMKEFLSYLFCARGLPGIVMATLLSRRFGRYVSIDDVQDLRRNARGAIDEGPVLHHTVWLYLASVLDQQDIAKRHRDIFKALRRSDAYWVEQATTHLMVSDISHHERMTALTDPELLSRRLRTPGFGVIHGEALRNEFSRAGTEEERRKVAARLGCRWRREVERRPFSAAEYDELLDLLEVAGLPGFASLAAFVADRAFRRTTKPKYLQRCGWIRYQALDQWDRALRDMVNASELFGDTSVEAARCNRLRALALFDMGRREEAKRWARASLKTFDKLGYRRDAARARETLGVILDAEGRWDLSVERYRDAERQFDRDPVDKLRVLLNRSIATLFLEGIERAWADLKAIENPIMDTGDHQLADYFHVNCCVIALLRENPAEFGRHAERAAGTTEDWLRDSLHENRAVAVWRFDKNPSAALKEFNRLKRNFARQKDAWGLIDNSLNAGFVHVDCGRQTEARRNFTLAYKLSRARHYPVGYGLAWRGLQLCNEMPTGDARMARYWYDKRLDHLFGPRIPFVPLYVLLAESLSMDVRGYGLYAVEP